MRPLVARCEVIYIGRLTATLAEAVRLIVLKTDGSVLVHDDSGGVKTPHQNCLAGYPARKWMLVRKVFDRPPYLVPLQETWHGRHCGPAEVDDPIPPDHTGGVEQLGNPWSCYGVALTIWAGKTHATRRAAIQCG